MDFEVLFWIVLDLAMVLGIALGLRSLNKIDIGRGKDPYRYCPKDEE